MQSKISSAGSCNFTELLQDSPDAMENGKTSYSHDSVKIEKPSSITFCKKKISIRCILTGLVIALSLACIGLGIFLVIQSKRVSTCQAPERSQSPNVCYSSECLQVASILLRDMNKSVDPCQNYMKFSCDGWVKNNPIDEGEDEQGSMFKLSNMNDQKLRYFVESLGKFPSNHPMFKVKNYYSSCMNEDAIEQHSLQDFKVLLDRLVKWPVLVSNWVNPSWDWVEILAHISSNVLVESPLIALNVMVNPKDTKAYIFQAIPPEMSLKEEYINNDTKTLDALLTYMVEIVQLMGGNKTTARPQMKDVIDFAIQVAKMNPSYSIVYSHWYDTYTISEVQSKSGFPWKKYINKLLEEYNITLTDTTHIVVPHVQYFKDLAQLLAKTNKRTLLNFLMWKVVSSKVMYLSSPFQAAYNKFWQTVNGISGTMPRWLSCIRRLNSEEVLTMAMGYLWIHKEFDKGIVPLLKEMMDAIKQAFKDEVADLPWLDSESRKKSIEKVDMMKVKMGFPALCNNITMLQNFYSDLDVNSVNHYLLNVINISDWYQKYQVTKLIRPVDENEWLLGPQIVNAFYKMSRNEILINAGILQPPFYYGKEAPRAVNFGAIGTVLGHELTHGFDSQGSLFNKYGEKGKPWMSNFSRTEFDRRSECLIDQYNNYFSDLGNGKKIKNDGVQTLAENIADNGGLRLSYRAYKNWVAQNGEEPHIPGVGLTNEQALFLAFGQVYCYVAKPSGIKSRIMTDSHAMPEFRTIGSVANLEGFASTYRCPEGSAMNPSKKCRVW